MEKENNRERLARMVIIAGAVLVGLFLCWLLRGVLTYIILAFVVSLIGQPVMRFLKRVKIKKKALPNSVLAVCTLVIIFSLLFMVVTQIIPVVSSIVRDAATMNASGFLDSDNLKRSINEWVVSVFPWVHADFDVVKAVLHQISDVMSLSTVTGILGSVASTVAGLTIGLFSVVFIAFFFIKDENLFRRIVGAMVPDRIEHQVDKTVLDIERLLSRYFLGLIVEVIGVVVLDCLGLWLIARIDFNYALGIAFIAGLLNVIPYIGPLVGEMLGVLLCVIIKCGIGMGLAVNPWIFAFIVLGIMLTTQIVDNMVYQPLIYSTSIKAGPLEIFIVLLVAGYVGGVTGMLVAIPAYTVVRVVASRFFYKYKAVRRLIPEREQEETAS